METKMKITHMVLIGLLLSSSAYAADQWAKGSPQGSNQAADIDSIQQINNAAQDRLLIGYRKNAEVLYESAATITVKAGEIAIPDSSGTVVRYRRNTSDTTVTWSDIDTGVEANSTQYYVWALADTDATTFTVKISASSTAPSGATYYKRLGQFYNDSSGNVTAVSNYLSGSIMGVKGTSDITTSSTSYVDTTDMSISFVASGRPVYVSYSLSGITSGAGHLLGIAIAKNGSTVTGTGTGQQGYAGINSSVHTSYVDYPTAGSAVTYTGQWKGTSTVYCTVSAGENHRTLTVVEL